MPIIEAHLSDELRGELLLATKMHSFIMEAFPHTITIADDRMNLLGAYVHLADDLYGCIPQLLGGGGGFDGGAFALIRPFIEACVMAQWLYFCATDDQVQRAHGGEQLNIGLAKMMEALDKEIGDEVFANIRIKVKALHGFTHGGIEQLGRRFDKEGNLKATYTDAEKIEILRAVTSSFTLLSSVFLKVVSGNPEADQRSAVVHRKFDELYGAGA